MSIFLLFNVMSLSCMHLMAQDNAEIENVVSKQVGDSVATVIMHADSIVANLTVWESDTLSPRILSPCMCSIVQYTLCQPVMYRFDKRVYSAFYADVRLEIKQGERKLTLELDYNINKWRLLDGDGKQICRHDLMNTELLSLMHELWPESKNINVKYEEFIK